MNKDSNCTGDVCSINIPIHKKFNDPEFPGEPKYALFTFIETYNHDLHNFLNSLENLSQEQLLQVEALKRSQHLGVGKIRGIFHTQESANLRAQHIIEQVDSVNSIFTCIVGVPFPLVARGMSLEKNEIDLQAQTEKTISQNVRNSRKRDQQKMQEIQQRQQELEQDVKRDVNEENLDNYVEKRVKLAHIRYFIEQCKIKREEYINNEDNLVTLLKDIQERNPSFEKEFMDKYMKARRAANIPETADLEGFMKYMNDPLYKL